MTKVVVAMSGGVDSSVAAALLHAQGYEVVGMMLRLWSEEGKEDSNRCCTPEAVALARRVCAKLEIPFYVIDAKVVFRKTVVQYFLDGHARGETPNPCLVCNKHIRWNYLFDHAVALEADYLATGHYARTRRLENGVVQLLRAADRTKDQSYILHVLTQDKLQRALFPVGDYTKPEVRKLAEEYGLPTAARHDSQDLCFLAGDDYRNFLKRNAADILRPGPIVSSDGTLLGEHSGLPNYTIGQRKGLGMAAGIPLYVLEKDAAKNTLRVGPREELGSLHMTAGNVHWTSGTPTLPVFRADTKIRYTAREAPADVSILDDETRVGVRFDRPQRDVTPGQAAVFFDGDIVLGGGIIEPAHP